MDQHLYSCLTVHPTHQQLVDTYGGGKVSNLHVARAAFMNNMTWQNNRVIKVAFLKEKVSYNNQTLDSGWTKRKEEFTIKTVTEKIIPLVNLDFDFNSSLEDADIRISFVASAGSWSYIGTDCLNYKNINEATLNLGWLDNDTDFDDIIYMNTGIVILHEFGHVLGMIHEHSREDASLQWNKDAVYKDFAKDPNYWTHEDCDEQIFDQVALSSFNGSVYDPKSVMHYWFPNRYFKVPPNLPKVTSLSMLDKLWINKKYPGKQLPTYKPSNWFTLNWPFIVVVFVFMIILYTIFKSQL